MINRSEGDAMQQQSSFWRAPHAARALCWALALFGMLFLGSAYWVHAAPPGQSAEEGKVLFEKNCASCHTIGGGDLVGPDLLGVTERRDRDWLEEWLSEPDEMIDDGDPIALELLRQYRNVPMPNQGLSDDEVEALILYLEASAGPAAAPAAPAVTPTPLPPGDPAVGKHLFTGDTGLMAGGSACISCHTVAGLGGLGGGTLGPDLTGALVKYGDAGLLSVLGNIPFPTMLPIFVARALTPQEQLDLHAFLVQSAAQPAPASPMRWLAIPAVLGAGGALVLIHLWRRRRLSGVRRSLVPKR